MRRHFSIYSAKFRERIDRHLSVLFDCSRSVVQRHMQEGRVLLNNTTAKPNDYIEKKDEIIWETPFEKLDVTAEELPLEIIYQDQDIVLVNKDPGVNMHPVPGEGGKSGTLVNALLHHVQDLGGIGGVLRPGIVHRLDKDTSGIAVVCKNDKSMAHFYELFAGRRIQKTYIALVLGTFREHTFSVTSMLGRDKNHRTMVTARDPINPKPAETHFRVLAEYEGKYALVACFPKTGRTHQIRVHLATIGHPIVGDEVYGREKDNAIMKERSGLDRQFLHAWALAFSHCDKDCFFSAPLKPDLLQALKVLAGFSLDDISPDRLKKKDFFVQ